MKATPESAEQLASESMRAEVRGLLKHVVPQTSSAGTHCKRTPALPSTRASGRSRDRSVDLHTICGHPDGSYPTRAAASNASGLT